MKQDVDTQYEIEFDYNNESVQSKYSEKAKRMLEELGVNHNWDMTLNLKTALLIKKHGVESKYVKYCKQLSGYNERMVSEFLKDVKTKDVRHAEYKSKHGSYVRDNWVNGVFFPAD